VWVSVAAQGSQQESSVVRIDPLSNEVVSRVPVEGYIEEIAVGAGGVWVWGARFESPGFSPYVVRIDPATNEVVARIPDVSAPLAVGGGSLWAVDRAGARAGPEGSTLLRIDPTTNQVIDRIPLGVAAWDIEFGEGFVWVLPMEPKPGAGDLLQVDPGTSNVVARIEIHFQDTGYPPTVYAPAVGGGLAWVPVCCPDDELVLVRVDAATGAVVGEPISVRGGAPFGVAAGHVWVIQEGGGLYGLNVDTLDVDEAVSGFDWPAGGFPDPTTELDPANLAVWVVNPGQGSVTRIDLAAPVPRSDRYGSISAEGSTFPEGRLLVQVG
jgi:DNA-binding beta-propeller fold protein YncE